MNAHSPTDTLLSNVKDLLKNAPQQHHLLRSRQSGAVIPFALLCTCQRGSQTTDLWGNALGASVKILHRINK